MATAVAIQSSIVNVTIGVLIGSIIESIVPPFDASSSAGALAFEAAVQVALNGVALASVGTLLARTTQRTDFLFR